MLFKTIPTKIETIDAIYNHAEGNYIISRDGGKTIAHMDKAEFERSFTPVLRKKRTPKAKKPNGKPQAAPSGEVRVVPLATEFVPS